MKLAVPLEEQRAIGRVSWRAGFGGGGAQAEPGHFGVLVTCCSSLWLEVSTPFPHLRSFTTPLSLMTQLTNPTDGSVEPAVSWTASVTRLSE